MYQYHDKADCYCDVWGFKYTCVSAWEDWLLVEKWSGKETGRNVLAKNVCDLSRSVLYWVASDALVLLLGKVLHIWNRSFCLEILCWTPWKSTGLPSIFLSGEPWSTLSVVWVNILLNWIWNNMTVLVSFSFSLFKKWVGRCVKLSFVGF